MTNNTQFWNMTKTRMFEVSLSLFLLLNKRWTIFTGWDDGVPQACGDGSRAFTSLCDGLYDLSSFNSKKSTNMPGEFGSWRLIDMLFSCSPSTHSLTYIEHVTPSMVSWRCFTVSLSSGVCHFGVIHAIGSRAYKENIVKFSLILPGVS